MKKFGYEATRLLRYAYAEEFEQTITRLAEERAAPRSRVHERARAALRRNHYQEYEALVLRLRAEAGYPAVSLVRKPVEGPRRDIDPSDALILFNRGMTVKQIAEYDGCTQQAVLGVLVPLLARRRKPAPWYDRSNCTLTAHDIAELLGVIPIAVQNTLTAA